MRRVAFLTSGGDCQALNATMRGVAKTLYNADPDTQIIGILEGYKGLMYEKYVEMNNAHPFREGNGRSMRIWLDMMFRKELSLAVDWSRIDKEDYLLAMERSPIRDIEIKHLLKNALTADINDRELFKIGRASCRERV